MIKIPLDSYTHSLYQKIYSYSTTNLDNLTVNPMPQTPAAVTLRAVLLWAGDSLGHYCFENRLNEVLGNEKVESFWQAERLTC